MIVNLSESELNHIISALERIERVGEYYGNREQFWSRHEKLYKKLIMQRNNNLKEKKA